LNLRLPEGELIHVPAERLERWLRPLIELELRGVPDDDELLVPGFVAAAFDDDAPGRFAAPGALDAVRDRITALLDLAPRTEPDGFLGTLRTYQRVGLAWLHALHDAGLGGLLADEMGLGKTVQLLAFLDGLAATGTLARAPALVIAPRSVVGTWRREAERFAPRLRPHVHLGTDRAHGAAALARHPLVITSYQTFARDQPLFASLPWTTAIFDEAQALKNPDTQVRAAAATVDAASRFAVTGTPIENHLGELWSQLDLAVPGLLGRRRGFDATIRRPIEENAAAVPLDYLRRRIRPFLLRRTKDQVALELPPKTEIVESIELDSAQRDLYETLRLKLDDEVRAALIEQGVQASTMVILDALLKLRQCCCDPRLVKLPEARNVRGSAKLERLIARLEELVDSGRSTLVFSQFTSMLALIERACAAANIPTVKLTGATRDRDEVIRRFQAGEAPVALVSLKAAGVGITLTRADTVIHYDPWWNPAAEAQATDRAHRIGQERPVMVYKLVARGTLEEAIVALQDDKRALTAAALRDGGVTHLAPDDLAALYRRVAQGAMLDG
jgi:SNF2 family DNA or RNA helicase